MPFCRIAIRNPTYSRSNFFSKFCDQGIVKFFRNVIFSTEIRLISLFWHPLVWHARSRYLWNSIPYMVPWHVIHWSLFFILFIRGWIGGLWRSPLHYIQYVWLRLGDNCSISETQICVLGKFIAVELCYKASLFPVLLFICIDLVVL